MDQANVGNMSGFYGRHYSASDLQRLAQANNHHAMMSMIGPGSLSTAAMMGGQSLDEIIIQNNKELQRRRSYQQQYGAPRSSQDTDPRRSSMLEFGSSATNDLDGFQFEPSPMHSSSASHSHNQGSSIVQRRMDSQRLLRRDSAESLGLNTQFADMGNSFGPITHSPVYHQTLNSSEPLELDVTNTFMPQSLELGMDFTTSMIDHGMERNVGPIHVYPQSNFGPSLISPRMHQNRSDSLQSLAQEAEGASLDSGPEQDLMEKMPNMNMSDPMHIMQNTVPQPAKLRGSNSSTVILQDMQDFNHGTETQQTTNVSLELETENLPRNLNTFTTGEPLSNAPASSKIPQYRNVYSSSGFDMLGVLMRVASRPKPQINIGAVDMSCAFVVCDVTQHDLPIVYCSDVFERLTGYTKHEILGRNCRFLQAPDGKVQSGVKRKYVDDQAVLHVKNMINQRQEAQISLINYRKGGQPFMNLLTMIPITYDSEEIKYYVGFQVDLVEQPTSITNKNPGIC